MYGLNIDPRNPQGNPTPAQLNKLGVSLVRYTFKDATTGYRPDQETVRSYRQQVEQYANASIRSLIILNHETFRQALPLERTAQEMFIQTFAARAAEIAKRLARWQPAFQVWQAPDHPEAENPMALSEVRYGQLLQQTYWAIKRVDAALEVVTGGLVSGQPEWLAKVAQAVEGRFPADAVAIHPYTKRPTPDWPTPDWGSGYVGDLTTAYREVTSLPLWFTEIGIDSADADEQAAYLRRFYQTIMTQFAEHIEQVCWFCYSDGMAYPYGLVDNAGQPKPAYQTYRQIAQAAAPSTFTIAAATNVSLDRLHSFAKYLEQHIAFGDRDHTLHQQMETELRGNRQRLSRADIWYIMNRMLAGSAYTIEQPEIVGLDALQAQKDLYGMLRSIVLATHQKTSALTGRIGAHVRISAESDANAVTNVEAVMRVIPHLLPGNRMIVMDAVKATADQAKLTAPDIFETDIFGQHRNGLVENHAWNLQRLVRAIRDRGYQDRVMLIMRLDGPDDGANVNIFNGSSVEKYKLAIFKFIRYLEAVLIEVPFKIVLGNEPDLFEERRWSDPNIDPREFAVGHFAPAMGAFMKNLARQRPDVTFLCPALSKNLKSDQLAYYTAFFGQERPDNLIPTLHSYGDDVSIRPDGRQSFIEQQIEQLRGQGKFHYLSGTEIGTNNPFVDGESLSEEAHLSDVILWLLLSTAHQAPAGQDNQWAFRVDPSSSNDSTAQQLSHIINRSEQRVLRNIQERGGSELQIVRQHIGQRPAYAVEYISHNTPTEMGLGATQKVIITIRNTSHRTWSSGGPNPVRLGYHWYTAGGQAVPPELWADNRTPLPYDLPSGATVTLAANLGAPTQAGAYQVRWDMVEELVTWFAWQGVPTLDVFIQVGDSAPPPGTLRVSASHNNVQTGADNVAQAIDGNPATRWSSRAVQQPGMWFEVDVGEIRVVSGLTLDSTRSPEDYPRGYVVRVSTDRNQWVEVARNSQNDRQLDVTFSSRQARYLRVEQTGRSDRWWWSINEVKVK